MSALTFRSQARLELIFGRGVRQGPGSFFCMNLFVPAPSVTELFFLHEVASALVKNELATDAWISRLTSYEC